MTCPGRALEWEVSGSSSATFDFGRFAGSHPRVVGRRDRRSEMPKRHRHEDRCSKCSGPGGGFQKNLVTWAAMRTLGEFVIFVVKKLADF